MIKYAVLLFLLIVPSPILTHNERPRRRPPLDYDTDPRLMDQLAVSNSWTPNRIISATYTSNPQTGTIRNGKVTMTVLPNKQSQLDNQDLQASQSLANAQTAEEFVTKAVSFKDRDVTRAPHSSYVKYDVYEKEVATKTKPQFSTHPQPFQPYATSTPAQAFGAFTRNIPKVLPRPPDDQLTRSSVQFDLYDYRHPHKTQENSEYVGSYTEPDSQPTSYNHQKSHHSSHYEDSPMKYELMKMRDIMPTTSTTTEMPRSELIMHIRESVMKYMQEMEAEGKFPAKENSEMKTYFRFPDKSTSYDISEIYDEVASRVQRDRSKPSKGEHESYYRPVKELRYNENFSKGQYSTKKPQYPKPSSISDQIDLTVKPKTQPKHYDLSALDVGQSWLHAPSHDNRHSHRERPIDQAKSMSQVKQKLHFNTQMYHDINSMTTSKERRPSHENNDRHKDYSPRDNAYKVEEDEGYRSYPSHSNVRDGLASVGASISVGQKEEHFHDREPAVKSSKSGPVHYINGVPVANPYKLDESTLKQVFKEEQPPPRPSEENYNKNSWHPYSPSSTETPSYDKNPPKHTSYNSYDPKYNHESQVHHNQPSSWDEQDDMQQHRPATSYQKHHQTSWDAPSDPHSHRPTSNQHRHHGASDLHGSASSQRPSSHMIGSIAFKKGKRLQHPKPVTKIKIKREKFVGKKQADVELDTEMKPPRKS